VQRADRPLDLDDRVVDLLETLRVPRLDLDEASATARARSSRTFRSSPKTLTPTSERIPVVSMLIRLMIG
jgi:hypothetical protein